MIDVPMADAILCFEGDVLEVFSRFDKDSARIHVGLIDSMEFERGVPLLTITLRGGLTRPQISFDEERRTDVEQLVSAVQGAVEAWRSAH
jgi:hypothetical protein